MKNRSIVLGTILIGVSGVIAGTLFAPGKGSRTRSRISKKGREYKDHLMENLSDFSESVSHPFENMVDQKSRLSKKAIAKAEKLKKNVNKIIT